MGADQLEPNCLNRALHAAIRNDNHINVGTLIVKGADQISEAIKTAEEERKPHARAMLLLVKAAMSGNRNLVLQLFGEPCPGLEKMYYEDEGFPEVQRAVISGKVSTVVPIEIARRNANADVREELLVKTGVNRQDGTVNWHGLRLLVLEASWLRRIHWVQTLRLYRNGLRRLPYEMGTYLKQVCDKFACFLYLQYVYVQLTIPKLLITDTEVLQYCIHAQYIFLFL